jgi:hypothetical protein
MSAEANIICTRLKWIIFALNVPINYMTTKIASIYLKITGVRIAIGMGKHLII